MKRDKNTGTSDTQQDNKRTRGGHSHSRTAKARRQARDRDTDLVSGIASSLGAAYAYAARRTTETEGNEGED
eukprot:scaffold19252_cov117-Isochrysis_galbana.AAC.10